MRHRVKKIKIKKGQDATQSTLKKLLYNFLINNRLETTVKKAKIIKSLLDRLVNRAKLNTQAAINILKKYLPDKKIREKLINIVQEYFNDRISGFTRVVKTNYRLNDGSPLARLEWVKPVVDVEKEKKNDKNQKEIKEKNGAKTKKEKSKNLNNNK